MHAEKAAKILPFCGFVLAFFKNPLGLISEDTINTATVVVIIVLGFITFLVMRKKGGGG